MLGLQNIKIVIIFGCLQCVVSIGCVLWVTLGRHQSGLKTSLGSKRYYSISLSKQLFIYFLYHRGLIKISSLWVLIRTRVDAFFVLLYLRIKGSPQPGERGGGRNPFSLLCVQYFEQTQNLEFFFCLFPNDPTPPLVPLKMGISLFPPFFINPGGPLVYVMPVKLSNYFTKRFGDGRQYIIDIILRVT